MVGARGGPELILWLRRGRERREQHSAVLFQGTSRSPKDLLLGSSSQQLHHLAVIPHWDKALWAWPLGDTPHPKCTRIGVCTNRYVFEKARKYSIL